MRPDLLVSGVKLLGEDPSQRWDIEIRGESVLALAHHNHERPRISDEVLECTPEHYAVPGLIDCHVHLTFAAEALSVEANQPSRPEALDRSREHGRRYLDAGITTVRDCGSWYRATHELRGDAAMPSIVSAGAVITWPGGHGHYVGTEVVGPAAARQAVLAELDAGADFIKVMATGGVMTEGVSLDDGLSTEELRTVVTTAHAAGLTVAAHCIGLEGTRRAIQAGVDSIEHGMHLDTPLIQHMVNSGTVMVPTCSALEALLSAPDRIPPWASEKAKTVAEVARSSFEMAAEAGVTIVAGTDAGTPLNNHAGLVRELQYMNAAGMSGADALASATRNAGPLVAARGRRGQLLPGYQADILIVNGEPTADLTRLREPVAVITNGRLLR